MYGAVIVAAQYKLDYYEWVGIQGKGPRECIPYFHLD